MFGGETNFYLGIVERGDNNSVNSKSSVGFLMAQFHRLLEFPGCYDLIQFFGQATPKLYTQLLNENVHIHSDQKVLEVGCGVGAHRKYLSGEYHGVDLNSRYIKRAKQNFSGQFFVMNSTKLGCQKKTFDHIVTIATFHHLSDAQLVNTLKEGLRVCKNGGQIHIIDAIYPLALNSFLKRKLFSMDRGSFPRTFEHLKGLIKDNFKVVKDCTKVGPLHDVCYIRIINQT